MADMSIGHSGAGGAERVAALMCDAVRRGRQDSSSRAGRGCPAWCGSPCRACTGAWPSGSDEQAVPVSRAIRMSRARRAGAAVGLAVLAAHGGPAATWLPGLRRARFPGWPGSGARTTWP